MAHIAVVQKYIAQYDSMQVWMTLTAIQDPSMAARRGQ